jgi:hypothetical protein
MQEKARLLKGEEAFVKGHNKDRFRQESARTKRTTASNARSTGKASTTAHKAHLERQNMTTTEKDKGAGLTDPAPQETPRAAAPDPDEQPTPPRVAHVPKSSDAPPQREPPEPPAQAAAQPESPAQSRRAPAPQAAESSLSDLDWMPPTEDLVSRFLNDVADIAPPQPRERAATPAPPFVLPAAISPEEAERKKAKAEPFWSQVVATPMGEPAPALASTRSRRAARRRLPIRLRWLVLIIVILILVVAGLTALLYIAGLPPFK